MAAWESVADTALVAFFTFIGCFILVPTLLGFLRFFGFYVIVEERRSMVYVLFGKVELVISEPGLAFSGWRFGARSGRRCS